MLAFAPLVHLHAHEDLWPMSAERFLEHSRLLWAHDSKCPDYSPTLGREVDPDKLADQGGLDAFDVTRLGVKSPNPYRHQPVDDNCEVHGSAFAASDHTRPYDRRERDVRLPLREGWYLDLDDDYGKGEERRDQEGAQTALTGVPVYADTYDEAVEKRPGRRIVYWFFYGLSRSPGPREIVDQFKHEGDWERISVLLEVKGDGRYLPVSARYHSHDEQRDIPWSALNLVSSIEEGLTHPVVYSARGSHASFARAGRYDAVFDPSGRKLLTVEDEAIACPRCPIWRTWENVRPAAKEPWYGFGGAWGDVRNMSDTSGPLGPSRYKTKGLSLSPTQTVAPAPDADISSLEADE
jgi:hypothetical protein